MILNRILSSLLLLLAACTQVMQEPAPEHLYRAGVTELKKGRAEKAIQLFEAVLAQGYESAALYQHLGTAYLQDKKRGMAILNYEKALLMNPANKQILANAAVVQHQNEENVAYLPAKALSRYAQSILFAFSRDELAVAGIFLWLLGLGLVVVPLPRGKVRLKQLGQVLMIAAVLTFTGAALQSYLRFQANRAVILMPRLIVKQAAGLQAKDAFTLSEGQVVTLEDHFEGWYKISWERDKQGWAPVNSLKVITLR